MLPRRVRCVECGRRRTARETDAGVEPYREECPTCGSREYEVLG